ncbi:MAG TPA: serine hydrolase domain-containing protein [Vicinamibacterales bacterium]|nr:serine hydrolase domain-containing protein [Vicinamibacterales bacterium]
MRTRDLTHASVTRPPESSTGLGPAPVFARLTGSAALATILMGLAAAGLAGGQASRAHLDAPVSSQSPASRANRSDLAAVFADIDRLFTEQARAMHAPGAAWGVVLDGRLAHWGATGVRDVEAGAPVDADTVFRIASMTKSFTALAVLQLRDEGRLSLDDPVERYVPELAGLRYPTADSPRITIRHLLTHGAGFPEDNPWGDRQLARTEEDFTRMLRSGIPFSNPPGIAYEYSNYGYAILGRVVSQVSRRPYEAYLEERILRPLGLAATTLHPSKVPAARRARGYRWEDGRWIEEPVLEHGAFGAMGGLLSSIRDLARYIAVFLDAWPPRDEPERGPLGRASLREMQQPWRRSGLRASVDRTRGTLELAASAYGYGLGITETCDFRALVGHSGGLPGYGSHMRWLPDYGAGIVVLSNLTYANWARTAAEALGRLVRGAGLRPRAPQPSPALVAMRDAVSRLIDHWDDELADRIAADNLFLDRSKERRRREIETLGASVGRCRPPAGFDEVENALRGAWTLECERGRLRVAVTLAPTSPPAVQYLDVRPAPPEPPRAATCVVQ